MQIHKKQNNIGYSLHTSELLRALKRCKFTLQDIAMKIGISARELQERLDDWDYFNADEIEQIVIFFGAKSAYRIIHFSTIKERKQVKRKTFGRKNE